MPTYIIQSTSNHESATEPEKMLMTLKDDDDARHWIINHLDGSRSWQFDKVDDPRDQVIGLYGKARVYWIDGFKPNETMSGTRKPSVQVAIEELLIEGYDLKVYAPDSTIRICPKGRTFEVGYIYYGWAA